MCDNMMIDITDYYYKKLVDLPKVNVNKDVLGIISRDLFEFMNTHGTKTNQKVKELK